MRKTFTIIIAIMLILSLSGCCLALAAGVGLAGYLILRKYGKLIYFGDYWKAFGTDASSKLTSNTEFESEPEITPATEAGFYNIVANGKMKGDVGGMVGKFATYTGDLNFKLTLILQMTVALSEPYPMNLVDLLAEGVGEPELKSLALSGTIAISNINPEYEPIIGSAENIVFNDTLIDVSPENKNSGIVMGGSVLVDEIELELEDFQKIIEAVSDMEAK